MIPAPFPQSNISVVAPNDLDESQCMTIPGYHGRVKGGNLDGATILVVAWQPTEQEIELIKAGGPIYLSFVGGIPPHFPSMSFEEATNPA